MKFFCAILAWMVMGVIIGYGILAANHGNPWLLLIALAGFAVAVGKIGCAVH